jgi:hypothetical protein
MGSSVDLSIGGVTVAAADVAAEPPAASVDTGRAMLFLPARSLRAGKTYGMFFRSKNTYLFSCVLF